MGGFGHGKSCWNQTKLRRVGKAPPQSLQTVERRCAAGRSSPPGRDASSISQPLDASGQTQRQSRATQSWQGREIAPAIAQAEGADPDSIDLPGSQKSNQLADAENRPTDNAGTRIIGQTVGEYFGRMISKSINIPIESLNYAHRATY